MKLGVVVRRRARRQLLGVATAVPHWFTPFARSSNIGAYSRIYGVCKRSIGRDKGVCLQYLDILYTEYCPKHK